MKKVAWLFAALTMAIGLTAVVAEAAESKGAPKTVLVYGDSNSWGFVPGKGGAERFGPDVRWPGVLAKELGPEWRVIENALNGRTTALPDPLVNPQIERNGLKTIGGLLDSHRPLDAVIIFLGTNDLKPRFGSMPVDILTGIKLLIAAANNPTWGPAGSGKPPAVLVICPTPIEENPANLGPAFAGGAAKSRELRPLFAALGEQTGVPILFAEDHIAVDAGDGIHFSAESHAKLGKAAAAWLQEVFKR